jgi:hypothetical protein
VTSDRGDLDAEGARADGAPGSGCDRDDVGLLPRLAALAAESWRDVDLNEGLSLHEYFTEDGVFNFAGDLTEGRAAIRQRYVLRRQSGARATIHLVSNFILSAADAHEAVLHYYICVFGADGSPTLHVSLPTLIGTIDDIFVLTDAGWRIGSRVFRPVFYDPTDRVGRRASGNLR